MSTESQLREKLRKIEALFAGAGTAGERLAAEAALERVRARLGGLSRQDPSIEMQLSMPDQWSRHLFLDWSLMWIQPGSHWWFCATWGYVQD
jgi:hypothetical protein